MGATEPVPRKNPPPTEPFATAVQEIQGPVRGIWREATLARAAEIEALSAWIWQERRPDGAEVLARAIEGHLAAARQATERRRRRWPPRASGSLVERATSNLDAAEAGLLQLASPTYILSQMPTLLAHVQQHLQPDDPRRQEFERIVRELEEADPQRSSLEGGTEQALDSKERTVEQERRTIVSIIRSTDSVALRERLRIWSFRNVLLLRRCL
jgi:hypothetical protein